ncbi:MAG: ACP S-malonyltransferase [Anaerolineae bacterium]|nr:ACP S-malonyltransferase [Anaerolineae bacterium]MDK1080084.1 ACP S-malonyltransferase [Anaerolineae bacterium]MDK1118609.1 ACP S-malonyltransferase [Anaerolineae bacterium]
MDLDSKTTTFVFPGQGSQTLGMGRDLANEYSAAKHTFEEANDILGFDLSKILWDGPADDLNDTINTQPALYVHSIAALNVFTHHYPDFRPASVAGHSLGELTALTAAGALSFSNGLKLVCKRGELMKLAGEKSPGSMAAILGLDIATLDKVCADASTQQEIVQVANDNCPGQVVISGSKDAVARAIEAAKSSGAKRGILLAVSIAAHSPLMDSISAEWNEAVILSGMLEPEIPVIGNVHAKQMNTKTELQEDIKSQMHSRVRWTESVQEMLKSGTKAFLEIGTGNVLIGMIRRIDSTVVRHALGNPIDFSNLAD